MNTIKQFSHWPAVSAVLLAAALFFRFCLRGYEYISYTLLFAAIICTVRRFASPGLWRVIISLICLGLIYFCAIEIPIIKNSFTDRDCERKYLIVLGAAVHGDSPSLAMQHRLEGALDYMTAFPESTAILSGGKGAGENISEAECMKKWLIEHGVPESKLLTEDKSTSTMENMTNSFEIIRSRGCDPNGNVAVVSSSYHLYRAKMMAKLLGVEAAGVRGNMGYPIYMLNCYIREAFGVTHLLVFGR